MIRRRSSMLIVVAAFLAAACSSSGASGSASDAAPSGAASGGSLGPIQLAATSWTLVDLDGAVPANGGARLTLEFRADGSAGGTAGCNSYGGSYTLDGTTIAFGPLVSTKMACEQPLMAMETTYLTALQATTSYGVDGSGNLVLVGTATLTFSPA